MSDDLVAATLAAAIIPDAIAGRSTIEGKAEVAAQVFEACLKALEAERRKKTKSSRTELGL